VSVKRNVDLIDQFAALVVDSGEPRSLAERTLEVIMSLNNGRSGAVFTCDQDRIALFASRAIDQIVLDSVNGVWSILRDSLRAGETVYVPDRATERRLPQQDGQKALAGSFAVVPVFEDEQLLAVLYVDSFEPHFCATHDLERLAKFSKIIAKAVADGSPQREGLRGQAEAWEAYLERTPVEDMEREKLLLLLNRNEWNIARVARLMSVTRRTIYLRLERYNIPRERVPKTRQRAKAY
jgi:transcriptional regulator with GAF, ATPase, and Fis domain